MGIKYVSPGIILINKNYPFYMKLNSLINSDELKKDSIYYTGYLLGLANIIILIILLILVTIKYFNQEYNEPIKQQPYNQQLPWSRN